MRFFLFIALFSALFPAFVMGQFSYRPVGDKQILEPINLKVIYDFHFVRDTVKKEIYEDRYTLEIGTNYAKFHSVFADRVDSVMTYPHLFGTENRTRGHSSGINPRLWMKSNQRENYDAYFWNYPKAGMLHVTDRISYRNYVYSENIPQIAWKVEDSTQIILGYLNQKATASFRGREWVVWFTLELPYSFGPWKLFGLPGLIVKAETADGYFSYTMVGIEKPKTEEYIYTFKSAEIKATRQDILRLKRRSWEDPIGLGRDHGIQVMVPEYVQGRRVWHSEPGSFSHPYRPFLELE